MKILFLISLLPFYTGIQSLVFDFGTEKSGFNWSIINDDVMGGRSVSTAKILTESVVFKGDVSLENNGGFVSLRSPFKSFDLSSFETMKIKFRGSNRTFGLMLEDSNRWYMPYLKYEFEGKGMDEWQELSIPLDDFKEYRIGEFTGRYASGKKLSLTKRIGFILFDKKEGTFELEIDYVQFE